MNKAFYLGLAFLAAALWTYPEARDAAARVLSALDPRYWEEQVVYVLYGGLSWATLDVLARLKLLRGTNDEELARKTRRWNAVSGALFVLTTLGAACVFRWDLTSFSRSWFVNDEYVLPTLNDYMRGMRAFAQGVPTDRRFAVLLDVCLVLLVLNASRALFWRNERLTSRLASGAARTAFSNLFFATFVWFAAVDLARCAFAFFNWTLYRIVYTPFVRFAYAPSFSWEIARTFVLLFLLAVNAVGVLVAIRRRSS